MPGLRSQVNIRQESQASDCRGLSACLDSVCMSQSQRLSPCLSSRPCTCRTWWVRGEATVASMPTKPTHAYTLRTDIPQRGSEGGIAAPFDARSGLYWRQHSFLFVAVAGDVKSACWLLLSVRSACAPTRDRKTGTRGSGRETGREVL